MKTAIVALCCLTLLLLSKPAEAEQQLPIIQIEKTHMSIQGHYQYISIFAHVGDDTVTSFDLTIAFQPDALEFIEVQSWARDLRYQQLNPADLDNSANTGFLQISGYPIPACRDSTGKTYLAEIQFLLSNSREFNCKALPIRFAWIECGDNTLVLKDGEQISAERVFDFNWDGDHENDHDEITGNDCNVDWFAHYTGICDLCDSMATEGGTQPGVFWNGVVDIACGGITEWPGDINQNGIDIEYADVESFTSGLLSEFDRTVLPDSVFARVTDTNIDCAVASVADLVYMVRMIMGDAIPLNKLAPRRSELCARPKSVIPYPWHAWIQKNPNDPPPPPTTTTPAPVFDSVLVEIRDGSLEISSDTGLAGIFAVFDFARDQLTDSLICLQPMQLEYKVFEGELRVLLWSGLENLTRQILAGRHALFAVPDGATLKFLQASDYNGNLLDVIHVTDSGQVRMPLVRE